MVSSLSRAAVAAGADGFLIEVRDNPDEALSDGRQSLTPEMVGELMLELGAIAAAVGTSYGR